MQIVRKEGFPQREEHEQEPSGVDTSSKLGRTRRVGFREARDGRVDVVGDSA